MLLSRPEAIWVMADEERIRFLAEGSRPVWINTGTAGTLSAPNTRSLRPSTGFLSQEARKELVGEEKPWDQKPKKKALILLPFNYEGLYDVEALEVLFRNTRDYCDGDTTCEDDPSRSRVTKRVVDYPRDESGNCLKGEDTDPSSIPQWASEFKANRCQPPRVIGGGGAARGSQRLLDYREFQTWRDYDFIFVTTHGARFCGTFKTGSSQQKKKVSNRPVDCVTVLFTGWYDRVSADPFAARRAESRKVPGVELVWNTTSPGECVRSEKKWIKNGYAEVLYAPNDPEAPIVPGTALYDNLCDDGIEFVLHEALTDDFFLYEYKEESDLAEKIIFLNSCSSLCGNPTKEKKGEEVVCDRSKSLLARHLTRSGSTALLGWTKVVTFDRGFRVAKTFLDGTLRKGWRFISAYGAAREDGLEFVGSGPTMAVDIRVINEDPDARLEREGYNQKRAREIIVLLNPRTGVPVADGSRVPTLGSADDGKSDRIDAVIQLEGIVEGDSPRSWPIHVEVDGREAASTYLVNENPRDGVYYYRGAVDLGFDLRVEQVSDINVWVNLPGGGISRCLHEDVILGRNETCRVQASWQGGGIGGTVNWDPDVHSGYAGFSIAGHEVVIETGQFSLEAEFDRLIEPQSYGTYSGRATYFAVIDAPYDGGGGYTHYFPRAQREFRNDIPVQLNITLWNADEIAGSISAGPFEGNAEGPGAPKEKHSEGVLAPKWISVSASATFSASGNITHPYDSSVTRCHAPSLKAMPGQ